MKGSSDNSFIPKRGASKRKQTGGSRQIYIFTYISYILMFATLLSSGGVYLYQQYINNQLDIAVEALNSEIGSFSQADMERVTQFNLRLAQAQDRLENSMSVTAVFEALQAATIDTVQINSLAMEREDDDRIVIEAMIQTDSFDSTIFQRGVFLRNGIIQDVEITDVKDSVAIETGERAQESNARPIVSFQASLAVPLEQIPADPQSYQLNQPDVIVPNTEIPEQPPELLIEQEVPAQEVNEDTL
jgi:hypothetical protein